MIAKNMGFEGDQKYIDTITKTLFEKNIDKIKPILSGRKMTQEVSAAYFNVSAMIMGFAEVQLLKE